MRRALILLGLLLLAGLPPAAAQAPTVSLVPGQWSLTQTVCGSAASSCVLKSSPGRLFTVYGNCTAACWLMTFNSTTAPSNGSTTAGTASGNMVECFDIAAGGSKSVSYLPFNTFYSVGIVAVISSTACATLTLSTVGYVNGTVF